MINLTALKVLISLKCPGSDLATMTMPEPSGDEEGFAPGRKYEVRASWEILGVQSVPEA